MEELEHANKIQVKSVERERMLLFFVRKIVK